MKRITREKCIEVYQIEIDFFNELMEAGLINTIKEGTKIYLEYDGLRNFEKLVAWHYDLEVNVPGLEVIHHLLQQIEDLQSERMDLIRRLGS